MRGITYGRLPDSNLENKLSLKLLFIRSLDSILLHPTHTSGPSTQLIGIKPWYQTVQSKSIYSVPIQSSQPSKKHQLRRNCRRSSSSSTLGSSLIMFSLLSRYSSSSSLVSTSSTSCGGSTVLVLLS